MQFATINKKKKVVFVYDSTKEEHILISELIFTNNSPQNIAIKIKSKYPKNYQVDKYTFVLEK